MVEKKISLDYWGKVNGGKILAIEEIREIEKILDENKYVEDVCKLLEKNLENIYTSNPEVKKEIETIKKVIREKLGEIKSPETFEEEVKELVEYVKIAMYILKAHEIESQLEKGEISLLEAFKKLKEIEYKIRGY